jgi:pimeloyl-ACP methyl ester carboxylesterase
MAKSTRLIKSIFWLILPVSVMIFLAGMVSSVWFVHTSAQPSKVAYLVTPEKYGRLSSRGAQVTNETWENRDGTTSRGWLLRGEAGKPAVVLLHRYGANRSHVLNLGVKLNEATDFTVLMPDQRGHGPSPLIAKSSFGGCEVEDTLAAVDFLKALKNKKKKPVVGNSIGIYGTEMGGLIGLSAASRLSDIKALALDSVPLYSNDVLASAVDAKFPFASFLTAEMAKGGSYLYFATGCYERTSICDIASRVEERQVLLLAGTDAPALRTSTSQISGCFPENSKVTTFTDLSPSGFNLPSVSIEQADSYEQKVIYFFKSALEQDGSDQKPKVEGILEEPKEPEAESDVKIVRPGNNVGAE